MDRVIKIIGNAVIERVERACEDSESWGRRACFVGFEGYLVIKMTDDGRMYAVIDNNQRCISTSCGELTLTADCAVFSTKNSTYTFRLVREAKAG
ncbi:MAG: hypothetical protein IJ561_04485 [Ruminococcus sp.]|nr:hypothetical protein [Ruminococcus sp.]